MDCICNRTPLNGERHSPACVYQNNKNPEMPTQNSYWRFKDTSDNSLIEYLLMLFKEIKNRADETENFEEKCWLLDASAMVFEITLRFDDIRLKTPMDALQTYRFDLIREERGEL